jgi:hypothetical protein
MSDSMNEKPKQLFIVSMTNEVIVVAEDVAEALRLAQDGDVEWSDCYYSAAPMSYFPGDWDINCIPFGKRVEEDPDRTIGDWMKKGAAPEYDARLKK